MVKHVQSGPNGQNDTKLSGSNGSKWSKVDQMVKIVDKMVKNYSKWTKWSKMVKIVDSMIQNSQYSGPNGQNGPK